jgi:hypothetical protein
MPDSILIVKHFLKLSQGQPEALAWSTLKVLQTSLRLANHSIAESIFPASKSPKFPSGSYWSSILGLSFAPPIWQ